MKKEAPAAPPAFTLQNAKNELLSINALVPFAGNPRSSIDEKDIAELAESIRQLGILQPIIARDIESEPGKYQIRAGHRRYMAALKIGLTSVPVLHAVMDEQTAAMVTVTENRDRKDLSPLEESRSLALLASAGMSNDEIAAKLGQSKTFIARRLNLSALTEEWTKAIEDRNQLASLFSVLMLEQIARLPAATQRTLFDEYKPYAKKHPDEGYNLGCFSGPTQLYQWIEREVLHSMSAAKWNLDDANLVPGAPACTTCPNRTANMTLLFPELARAKKDQCTQPDCYNKKLAAHNAAAYAKSQSRFDTPLPIIQHHYGEEKKRAESLAKVVEAKIESPPQYYPCKASAKGARPFFDAEAGAVKYFQDLKEAKKTEKEASGERKPSAAKTRSMRRKKNVIESLLSVLYKAESKKFDKPLEGLADIPLDRAAALLQFFSTPFAKTSPTKSFAEFMETKKMPSPQVQSRMIVSRLVGSIADSARCHSFAMADTVYPHARRIAELFEIDWEQLEAAALKKFPEPATKKKTK